VGSNSTWLTAEKKYKVFTCLFRERPAGVFGEFQSVQLGVFAVIAQAVKIYRFVVIFRDSVFRPETALLKYALAKENVMADERNRITSCVVMSPSA